MPSVVALEDVELIPVLELEPSKFGADGRSGPSGSYTQMPEAWHRYWSDALADAEITGLMPIQMGSWHVPASAFADIALLGKVLEAIDRNLSAMGLSGELDSLPLNGGLALRCQSQNVLIEPGCCADLGNVADWREVVGYKGAEWRVLWIGHPWLSARYEAPRLIISGPHEGEDPAARWSACPDQLQAALVAAEVELERFAGQISRALPSRYEADSRRMGRRLAGLDR